MALDEQARHAEDRLAKLLTRNIIASDTTRRLLFAHMARQWGGGEQIRQAHDSARTASINALRERGWAAALRLDVEELARMSGPVAEDGGAAPLRARRQGSEGQALGRPALHAAPPAGP